MLHNYLLPWALGAEGLISSPLSLTLEPQHMTTISPLLFPFRKQIKTFQCDKIETFKYEYKYILISFLISEKSSDDILFWKIIIIKILVMLFYIK